MKEVWLESRAERMNRVCLSNASGQSIPPGRGDVTESLPAISLCVTVLGHRNIRELLALLMVFKKRRRKKTLLCVFWRRTCEETNLRYCMCFVFVNNPLLFFILWGFCSAEYIIIWNSILVTTCSGSAEEEFWFSSTKCSLLPFTQEYIPLGVNLVLL